jgi:hypothetical protein
VGAPEKEADSDSDAVILRGARDEALLAIVTGSLRYPFASGERVGPSPLNAALGLPIGPQLPGRCARL